MVEIPRRLEAKRRILDVPVGVSMELGRRQWKLGFTTGVGQRARRRTLSTDAWDRLPKEIAARQDAASATC